MSKKDIRPQGAEGISHPRNLANHSLNVNDSSTAIGSAAARVFDMLAFSGRAFDIACTLETLRAAMPDDTVEAEIPLSYMVGMLAGQVRALADSLFELPFTLVEQRAVGEVPQ